MLFDTMTENDSPRQTDAQPQTAETPEDDPRGGTTADQTESAPADGDGVADESPDDSPEQSREEYVEEAQQHEETPAGFEPDWSLEDTQVPDKPVVVDVDGLGEASAKLVTWEVVEEMQEDDGTFGAPQVAKILRDHYRAPDMTGLRADTVRSMRMDRPDALLSAIMPGMDTQMNADGSAQVDSGNR